MKMICRVCGAVIPEGCDFCPVCQTPVETSQQHRARPKQTIYTNEYLAGIIDSEGSFFIAPVRDTRTEMYFLEHRFEIELLAAKEWMDIADHLLFTYGGHTRTTKRNFYRWTIRKEEELLPFINHFLPLLKIKRTDAQTLNQSLQAYKKLIAKGKPTKRYWTGWIQKFKRTQREASSLEVF